jgi:PIN domain nuclease of toxin-antitoxin system
LMQFLIDTHCWLWAVKSPDRLLPSAAQLIENESSVVRFSAISALEIAIKVSIGKLQLSDSPKDFILSQTSALSMVSLPVTLAHAIRVASLPLHHRDPFDRLLVAQAQVEGIPLMTADEEVAAYDVEIIWAGRSASPNRSSN